MQGLLIGAVFAGLQRIAVDMLRPPVEWEPPSIDEPIRLKLASGMRVTITVQVDPAQ